MVAPLSLHSACTLYTQFAINTINVSRMGVGTVVLLLVDDVL